MTTSPIVLSLPAWRSADDGSRLSSEADATDVIGQAWGAQADIVVIPVTRFVPEFFDLSTRLAGEFIQKFVNYRVRLVIVGDLSAQVARSEALAAFVAESNRGRQVRFVARDVDAAVSFGDEAVSSGGPS